MDILWGNANGYFVGKCQWIFCGEMPIDMWGNANGYFVGKCQWTFCGEMSMYILWGNASANLW